MLLLEKASSARLAIEKENKYEFILSTYDPQLPGSDKHKLGYFGIPTLVKIKSLSKLIYVYFIILLKCICLFIE